MQGFANVLGARLLLCKLAATIRARFDPIPVSRGS